MTNRYVISKDGAWQVGDEVTPSTLTVNTGNIATGKLVYIDSGGNAQLADCTALATAEVVGVTSNRKSSRGPSGKPSSGSRKP